MRLVVEQLALERAVEKAIDQRDRRNQVVSITGEGRLRIKQDQERRTRWIAQLLKNWTIEERQRAGAAIETLEKLLGSATAKNVGS